MRVRWQQFLGAEVNVVAMAMAVVGADQISRLAIAASVENRIFGVESVR